MGRRKTNLAKCFVISPNDSIFVAPRRRAAVSSGVSPPDHRCPPRDHRGVAQLVAHLVWDQRVACSSHVTPTFFIRGIPSPETPSAFSPFRFFSFVENTRPGRSPDGDIVASLLYLPSIQEPLFSVGDGSSPCTLKGLLGVPPSPPALRAVDALLPFDLTFTRNPPAFLRRLCRFSAHFPSSRLSLHPIRVRRKPFLSEVCFFPYHLTHPICPTHTSVAIPLREVCRQKAHLTHFRPQVPPVFIV